MRYKLIGTVTLLFGLTYTLLGLNGIFFAMPRISRLYSQFEAGGNSLFYGYLMYGLSFLIGVVGMFLVVKEFSKEEMVRKRFFNYSLIYIAVTFFVGGLLSSLIALFTVVPIYNAVSGV